jgi:hypothetical protein
MDGACDVFLDAIIHLHFCHRFVIYDDAGIRQVYRKVC